MESHLDEDCGPGELTHATADYRRALWAVAALNIAYGVIEIGGGFLASSQGVKADALDFLGDGSITLLAILALGWGEIWRARAALLQGIFLAAIGGGVLLGTAYRVFVVHLPQAELMSAFGLGALAINVLSAAILIKHRQGDANVQAVWLFSRNDALGNIAIIIAAALVWASGTAWPDLIVAAIIAGLFLQGAWVIVQRAKNELANDK